MTLTAHLITVLLPGVVLDWLLGDPHWMPHPVRWMGRAITWLEGVLRRVFPGTPAGERLAGALLALLIPAAFGGGDLPRVGAVIMQYTGHSDYTENDPPTFACVGERDGIANWRTMERRLQALSALGIPTEFHHYPGLSHGFGLGTGTVAEGWLDQAVAFWEANTSPSTPQT